MVSEPEVITAPAAEPLSLIDAKDHLRVAQDFQADDATIWAMIADARDQVEDFTRNRLITQTLRFTYDYFGPTLRIPVWPVQSVVSVEYTDTAGATQTLAASRHTLIKRKPREIGPAYSDVWPTTRSHWGAVRVTVIAGYGDDGGAVPPAIIAGMKLVLGSLYENREAAAIGVSVSELPGMSAARAKLAPHILWF